MPRASARIVRNSSTPSSPSTRHSLGVDLQPVLSTTADLTGRRTSGDDACQVHALAPQTDGDDLLAGQSAELDVDARNALLAQVRRIVLHDAYLTA